MWSRQYVESILVECKVQSIVEVVRRGGSDDGGHEISVLTFHSTHTHSYMWCLYSHKYTKYKYQNTQICHYTIIDICISIPFYTHKHMYMCVHIQSYIHVYILTFKRMFERRRYATCTLMRAQPDAGPACLY